MCAINVLYYLICTMYKTYLLSLDYTETVHVVLLQNIYMLYSDFCILCTIIHGQNYVIMCCDARTDQKQSGL